MLAEIKELQTNAVNKLVEVVERRNKDMYTFRAPTGSGKTYMMADFMDKMLQKHEDVIFLVSSLSKSDLAKQNYDKFCEYRNNDWFPRLNPYLMNSEISGEERLLIPSEYNVYLLPRDLYKQDSRLMAGPMIAFLAEMRFAKGKSIIWIKDECHIKTKNLDAIAPNYFKCTINFSATPNLKRGQHPDVEITDSEAENCKLIKTIEWGDEAETVEDALNKFQEIKTDYRNLLNVNPCLIIQISNKTKADEELQNDIFPALAKYPELKWILIVNNTKECDTNDVFKVKRMPVNKWKEYARNDLSGIDVIIFKLVISEGWDVPRACMLYQARNSRSEQLDEQVIGRIRRNPRLLDFETLSPEGQRLAMTAWVWGVSRSEQGKAYAVKLHDDRQDIQNAIKIKTTVLKQLTDKIDFDLDDFLSKQKPILVHKSIFELNKQIQRADYSVKKYVYDNSPTYSKWWEIAEHVHEITKENEQYRCDYASSMEVGAETSFAEQSYYTVTDKYVNISNWVWGRKDGAEKFSFDSAAERDWAEILKDISYNSFKSINTGKKKPTHADPNQMTLSGEAAVKYTIEKKKKFFMWGKNYIPESTIRFEYYLGATHSSYPDFIMKDKFGRIHIFEVKSIQQSSSFNIDKDLYLAKVEELKKCYKQASKLTGQCFYIPIQFSNDIWSITMFENGAGKTLTIEQFRNYIKTAPKKK